MQNSKLFFDKRIDKGGSNKGMMTAMG